MRRRCLACWWGLRSGFAEPLTSPGDAWYYSGVVYFSIGFGDLLPVTGLLRVLTIIEGLSGLGTLGLVIGFLVMLMRPNVELRKSAGYSKRSIAE